MSDCFARLDSRDQFRRRVCLRDGGERDGGAAARLFTLPYCAPASRMQTFSATFFGVPVVRTDLAAAVCGDTISELARLADDDM